MSEIDEVRQSLRRLGRRLAEGEVDADTYDQLRDRLLADLSPEERAELGLSATPAPSKPPSTPPPLGSTPFPATPGSFGFGPSGGKGKGVATRIASLSDLDLKPGSVLFDQWRIERELGRGGFGVVVEAEELTLGERQAVKVLDPAMVARPELLERFRREVKATRKLVHPRIVRVFDYRENLPEGLALFSMEYVRGCSVQLLLSAAREKGEAVPVPLAVAILAQVLEALEAAHAQGVIHRDVTPANILLAGGTARELLSAPARGAAAPPVRDPQVKLVDFGIAGALERSELSQKSRVLGTAAYVAPEVLDPRVEVTTAADVYGAGAVFYELLTGKAPLGRFGDPSRLRPGLAPRVEALSLSLLESEPAARPSAKIAKDLALEAIGGEASDQEEEAGNQARAVEVAAAREAEERAARQRQAQLAEEQRQREAERAAREAAARAAAAARAREEAEQARRVAQPVPPSPPITEPARASLATPRPRKTVSTSVAVRVIVLCVAVGTIVGWMATRPSAQPVVDTLSAIAPPAAVAQQDPLEKAQALFKQGRVDAALGILTAIPSSDPRHDQALVLIDQFKSSAAVEERAPQLPEALPTSTPVPEPTQAPVLPPTPRSALSRFIQARSLPALAPSAPEKSSRAGIRWVTIPAGSFTMGCTPGDGDCESDEKPRHRVTLTRSFQMAATETTNAQYRACVEEGACSPPSPRTEFDDVSKRDHPVVNVSWEDAVKFCHWAGGRLATEAEWEYAARGGKEGNRYPWGNTLTHDDANYGKDSRGGATGSRDQWMRTSPVGRFAPNGFGLYDLAGNVWEWCADRYDDEYYGNSPSQDPAGPSASSGRVLRGGSWSNYPQGLRVSVRPWDDSSFRSGNRGFRPVRGAPSP